MQVADAQREVRTVFVGGFWGQLSASAIWLASAALGTWGTPRSAILELIVCGFFIFPATQLLLHLERFQDRCALSIFNARSPLHGVGSTWVHALGYSNPETAIAPFLDSSYLLVLAISGLRKSSTVHPAMRSSSWFREPFAGCPPFAAASSAAR